MSYRCGLSDPLASALGETPGPARITCDGCGVQRGVTRSSGLPYAWFLANRAPPSWSLEYQGDNRVDLCPRCQEP